MNSYSYPPSYPPMRYVEYKPTEAACMHVVLSNKAYISIISDVLRRSSTETGGVFLGRIYKKIWYVVDVIDEGIQTQNYRDYFSWDKQYVNHLAERIGTLYKEPLTILGFWHRHPQSFDRFSQQDEQTIQAHLREAKYGLLSMLVNVDPELRMTFYWCHDTRIMQTKYDVGDEYFAQELLQLAKPEELIAMSRTPGLRIKKNHKNNPEAFVKSASERAETYVSPGRAPAGSGRTFPTDSVRQSQNGYVTGRGEQNSQQILEQISAGISDRLMSHFYELETETRALMRRAVDTQEKIQQSANALNEVSGELRRELENQTDTLTNLRESQDIVRLTQKRNLEAIQSSIYALQKRLDSFLTETGPKSVFPGQGSDDLEPTDAAGAALENMKETVHQLADK